MKFELYEDVKVTTWCRYSYEVEAETLEEAVELVKDCLLYTSDAADD